MKLLLSKEIEESEDNINKSLGLPPKHGKSMLQSILKIWAWEIALKAAHNKHIEMRRAQHNDGGYYGKDD